jgi:hypothetical protein
MKRAARFVIVWGIPLNLMFLYVYFIFSIAGGFGELLK